MSDAIDETTERYARAQVLARQLPGQNPGRAITYYEAKLRAEELMNDKDIEERLIFHLVDQAGHREKDLISGRRPDTMQLLNLMALARVLRERNNLDLVNG